MGVPKRAPEYLRRLGYYRLSGYWYPCHKLIPLAEQQTKSFRPRRSDEFIPGARFQDSEFLDQMPKIFLTKGIVIFL